MTTPMPPSERLAQQVLTTCQIFYGTNGTDAHTSEGMRTRATIWALTGRKPSVADFEEALDQINERGRIESNTLGLWNGDREIWPRDPDYAACKSEHLDVQDSLIMEAVGRLIPNVHKP